MYNDLRNLARRDGRDPAEYFTLYALEGLLTRLAASDFGEGFVLKGGVLMAAMGARRPTRDIDLAASGLANTVEAVERRIREIAGESIDDGIEFEIGSVSGEEIRDDAEYSGARVRIGARLASASIRLHVDVSFGDQIWPQPVETELPRLLSGDDILVLGYPIHMVLAEKIVTALERAEANTRWRDFVDIHALTNMHRIAYSDQRMALSVVADY